MTRHLVQKNSSIRILASLLAVAMLVCGCNKKENTAPIAVSPVPAQPKLQEAQPIQKPLSTLSIKLAPSPSGNQFEFSGKKDPFKPDVAVKPAIDPSSNALKKVLQGRLPILSFDVSQFRLIGIVTSANDNQAMVVDPNGKGYVLKPGMIIGKNNGRVIAVTRNGVEVVEQFKDDSGRVRKENIRITLPRKQ